MATCSLVCGLFGFLTGPITGLIAIFTGHAANKKIRLSGGAIGGSGAAMTGLILGYVTTVLAIAIIPLAALATPQIYKALKRAQTAENLSRARQMYFMLSSYASDHDGQFPASLDAIAADASYGDYEAVRYMVSKSENKDWIYFPDHSLVSHPSSIILISPEPVLNRGNSARIVLRLDGSAKLVPERLCEDQLREQGHALP